MLGQHIGEVLGVRNVPIDYQAEGKRRRLRINGVAESAIEDIEGQGGAEVTVKNHNLCIAPGYPLVNAKTEKLSYQDHGLNWDLSGTNGWYSPFSYQGP